VLIDIQFQGPSLIMKIDSRHGAVLSSVAFFLGNQKARKYTTYAEYSGNTNPSPNVTREMQI